jgi:hypothetical protein
MWGKFLKINGVKSLYFDAFANDSFEDPFMALVGSIDSLIEKEFSDKPDAMRKLKEFKGKAVKVGTRLLSLGAKFGIKAITLNVIDSEQLKGVVDDIASDVGESASKFVADKLNSYTDVLNATEDFRNKLGELANEAYKENQKPLVFIIDELDRCRPTYALELIEKVKHLFSVKHIVFVLVMHTDQLEESIRCVYGQNIDARTYLQKFINIECTLPKNTTNVYENDYIKYCNALCELHGLGAEQHLIKMVALLSKAFKLSMRDLQRCFTVLILFNATKSVYIDNGLVALLIILKVKLPKTFEKLKYRNIALDDAWGDLKLDQVGSEISTIRNINRLRLVLRACLLPKEEYDKLDQESEEKKYIRNNGDYLIDVVEDRGEIIPYHCIRIESFKFVQDHNIE